LNVKETVDTEIRVRYAETDKMGVVYYANYLVWFEVGRAEFCRQRGFSYAELEQSGFLLVVAEVRCRYLKPARYDESVIVRTRLKEAGRRVVGFGYQVLRPGKEELLAEGETRHVSLDLQGKPRSLPEAFMTRLTGEGGET
jgi:acyl-CoA thioester hydrolase